MFDILPSGVQYLILQSRFVIFPFRDKCKRSTLVAWKILVLYRVDIVSYRKNKVVILEFRRLITMRKKNADLVSLDGFIGFDVPFDQIVNLAQQWTILHYIADNTPPFVRSSIVENYSFQIGRHAVAVDNKW